MRLFVLTGLSLFATPALACGMYIPEDLHIASIDSLFDTVDGPQVVDAEPQPRPQLAQLTMPLPTAIPEVSPAIVLHGTPAAPLSRKDRRQLERQARKANRTAAR